ncbi:MAG: hypothetical protein Q9M40_01410 [Sulfurimonas sp.]|nr:hypothetical protein [Sulfurimonas sp.]
MKKEENAQNSDISQLGNVDQIREILFGSQSRELQEKFDKLEASIKNIHEEMRKKMEQTQIDFNSKIENEVETISRKIKNMTTQQQDEFADVRDSALKQEKRLLTSLDIVEEELNAKREQLQKQQTENNTTLRSQMDTLKDELLCILDEKISALGLNKLSRDDAADIMMEAAMAMKGTQIDQQLSMANIEKA